MSRSKLIFKSVSNIVGFNQGVLIVLVDETETRQLSVLCDKSMLYQIGLRLSGNVIAKTLLPEALLGAFGFARGDNDMELFVYNIVDGQYKVILTDNRQSTSVRIRMSDAVLLTLISDIPMFVSEPLLEQQGTPYIEGSKNLSVPLNSLSNAMLDEALGMAVRSENYELACRLRDEKQRRADGNMSIGGFETDVK